MLRGTIIRRISFVVILVSAWMTAYTSPLIGQTVAAAQPNVQVAALKSEVRDFMAKEVAVHFDVIKSFTAPPDRVNGSITTGEYTWGSFMRVVAAQSDIGGSQVIGGRDTARPIAEMGLYEAR